MRELVISISVLLCLFLYSCDQIETEDVYSKSDSTYAITYFVQSDSAYIWYNTACVSRQHYVKDWDTTFSCHGGWCINVSVTAFDCSCYTGIVINGDTVDGCSCGTWCMMGFYLE